MFEAPQVDLSEAEAKDVAEKRAEMFRRATKAAVPTGPVQVVV